MHGRAKDRSTDAEKEKKRKEKVAKAKEYKEGMEKIFEKRTKAEMDDEALRLMSDILVSHPDVYTLWNFRKEILLSYKDKKTEDELGALVAGEMRLTEVCLRANPKSYCSWYHRLWLINNLPKADLETELMLCNKYLKLDSRNFHCWDYRRAIANKLGLSTIEELTYTMTKIEENFSNYSSWHYRSKLLPLIYEDPAGIRPIQEEIHMQELDLVQNAAFTDPYDQSAWFYLRWLLGRLKPKVKVIHCFIKGGNCYVALNRNISLNEDGISLESEGGMWKSANSKKSSALWISTLEVEPKVELKITFKNEGTEEEIILNKSNKFAYFDKPQFDADVSNNLLTVLKEQLDSCNQLLDLEPESKWTLLTSVVLMQAIDKTEYKDEIYKRISLLSKYDQLRINYYFDLRSRFIVESKLEEWDPSHEINLSNLDLTSLYHSQYLCYADKVDLSSNSLTRHLTQLFTLSNCQELNLAGNKLTALKGFPHLPNLRKLTLSNNNFTKLDDIREISKLKGLKEIDISQNPIAEDSAVDYSKIFPGINVICSK